LKKARKSVFHFSPSFKKKCSRPATFCLKLEEREKEKERGRHRLLPSFTPVAFSVEKERGARKEIKNDLAYSEYKNLHLHQPPLQAGSKCFPSLFESIFTN
jgi:hypothetical protein